MRTLIIKGTIVRASGNEEADILIDGGTISATGKGLSHSAAEMVIDAEGMYVLPGGVDPHVHMHLPSPAGYSSDDFFTGSRAALFGGTTTIIDFVTPQKGEPLTEALKKRRKEAEPSLTDYSFHVSPVEWRGTMREEIKACIKEGITSFKVYMAYKDTIGLDDNDLLRVLKEVAAVKGIVTIHCEDGDEIEKLQSKYFNVNKTSPLYHSLSRPALLEAEAAKKAIEIAAEAGCPLYIVHVSSAETLKYIRQARSRHQVVYAETCPQYLMLNESKYHGEFDKTAPYVISPPLRTEKDNTILWNSISDGTICSVGTDHCPFTMKQKRAGADDFRKIPGGAGGVEHRLSLLYTYGVLTKRLNFNQLVKIFSAEPARIFGLSPRKGEISIGSDADLVIWNPDHESIIRAKTHHQNCDVNIYEGIKVTGRAEYVITGGDVMIRKGEMTGLDRTGKYLFRTVK